MTKWVELVGKKEFATTALDLNNKIFIIYISFFINSNQYINVYLFCRAQIAILIIDGISIAILAKYNNFTNIFLQIL